MHVGYIRVYLQRAHRPYRAVSDQSSKQLNIAIDDLHKSGLKTFIATGDYATTAQAVVGKFGINEARLICCLNTKRL